MTMFVVGPAVRPAAQVAWAADMDGGTLPGINDILTEDGLAIDTEDGEALQVET